MLSQMGKGPEPEPNLGMGEIAVRPAKLAHGFKRERVLEVDREKTPQRGLLDLNGFLGLCSCFTRFSTVSGSRALTKVVFADGISALSVGIGCAMVDAYNRHRRERWAVPPCVRVCEDLPLCAAVSQGM